MRSGASFAVPMSTAGWTFIPNEPTPPSSSRSTRSHRNRQEQTAKAKIVGGNAGGTPTRVIKESPSIQSSTASRKDTAPPPSLSNLERKEIEVTLYEVGCLDEIERRLIKTVVDLEEIDPHLVTKPVHMRVPVYSDSEQSSTQPSQFPSMDAIDENKPYGSPTQTTSSSPNRLDRNIESANAPRGSLNRSRSISIDLMGSPGALASCASQNTSNNSGSVSARETRRERGDYNRNRTEQQEPIDPVSLLEYYQKKPNPRKISGFVPGLARKPVSYRLPKPPLPLNPVQSSSSDITPPTKSTLPPISSSLAEVKRHNQSRDSSKSNRQNTPHKPHPPRIMKPPEENIEEILANQVLEVARELDPDVSEEWIWETNSASDKTTGIENGFREIGIQDIDELPGDVVDGLLDMQKPVDSDEHHFSRRDYSELLSELKKNLKSPRERQSLRQFDTEPAPTTRKYGKSWYIPPNDWAAVAKNGTAIEDHSIAIQRRRATALSKMYGAKAYAEHIIKSRQRTPRFMEGIDLRATVASKHMTFHTPPKSIAEADLNVDALLSNLPHS